VVEGVLKLADDLGVALGACGRPDQGGDHAGVDVQGLDLLGRPGPAGAPDRREGAGGTGRALDRDAQEALDAGQRGEPGQGRPAAVAGQVGGADRLAAGQDLQGRAGPELGGGLLEGLGQVAGGDRPAQLAGLVDQHQGDPGDQEQPGRRDQGRAHDRLQRVTAQGRGRRWRRPLQSVLVVLHGLSCGFDCRLGRRPVTSSPKRGRPDRRPRTRTPADRRRPLLDGTRDSPVHYAPRSGEN
jgi:hypothetical protein